MQRPITSQNHVERRSETWIYWRPPDTYDTILATKMLNQCNKKDVPLVGFFDIVATLPRCNQSRLMPNQDESVLGPRNRDIDTVVVADEFRDKVFLCSTISDHKVHNDNSALAAL